MNGDLIRRGALIAAMGLETATKWGNKSAEQQHNSYSTWMCYEIADEINGAPSVDAVEVVHACRVWETRERDEGQAEVCVCSLCGAVQFAGLGRAAFCYGCGARMKAQTDQRPETGEGEKA